jgi:chromosome partitioning protein
VKRIAIAADKGGTGKTTTAVTLAHALALAGERVLLVDCDPRGDAGFHFGLEVQPGLADWLGGGAAQAVEVRGNLFVLPSGGPALAELDAQFATSGGLVELLRAAFDRVCDIDWIVVDCPAGAGMLSRAAIATCDVVVMPLATDYLSLSSARDACARLGTDGSLRLLGILPTFYDRQAPSAADPEAVLAALHAGPVFQARIGVSSALRDAPALRGTVFDCEPLSRAALDYARFANEVRAAATATLFHAQAVERALADASAAADPAPAEPAATDRPHP